MKTKFLCVIIAIMGFMTLGTGCQHQYTAEEQKADMMAFREWEDQFVMDSTISPDQKNTIYKKELLKVYRKHRNDSLGITFFCQFLFNEQDTAVIMREYNRALPIIKDSKRVNRHIDLIRRRHETDSGQPYKEIRGIDPLTGDSVCLSQFFTGDKKIVLDFWASWCNPCKQMISTHLQQLCDEGQYQIIGIAMWDDDMEAILRVMNELNVRWPVIYTGLSKDNPVTQDYCISGVPQLIYIAADGIIEKRD